jgi:hypothetical protein
MKDLMRVNLHTVKRIKLVGQRGTSQLKYDSQSIHSLGYEVMWNDEHAHDKKIQNGLLDLQQPFWIPCSRASLETILQGAFS